ncbi:MAG TPA: BTAD domain-containing putative transcriptional regulator [Chloroflexota bacterium]|nr:BTAD domain-containing putative transcriptional regulator [Chloroflexota bacterium]
MARAGERGRESLLDPTVTLGILIAALEEQRRAMLFLGRLLQALGGASSRPRKRRPRARLPGQDRPAVGERRRGAAGPSCPALDGQRHAIEIRCFGHFEVYRQGELIESWRRAKAKALLKYLIARRQPVSRDALIELLWPDADPRLAVNGLRVTLYALRQALGLRPIAGRPGQDIIVFEGGSYYLNPSADIWVDAEEFSARFADGLRLERQGHLDAAIGHFERAEEVYRDDYLLEDIYEEWTLVRREELKDQYLMVLTRLADIALARGDLEGCIIRCHKILGKDACREDAYQRLMRCHAMLGQWSQAIHWYDLCSQTLRHELDMAPSEQTVALYRQICTGQVPALAAGVRLVGKEVRA